jgi:shikimate dehydrogenase
VGPCAAVMIDDEYMFVPHTHTVIPLKVGLIGNSVVHSFSSRLQQAAFDALHIPARYELWHTPDQELVARVRALCNDDALGANVTLPYQQSVIPLLDKVDPLAAQIGAVNTIVHQDDYLYGYNTDAPGLLNALLEHGIGKKDTNGQLSLQNYAAVLLGASEVARSAAFALVSAGVAQLIILNRHLERAQLLAANIQQYYDGPVFCLSDPTFLIPRSPSLIINATSVGLHGDESPLPADVLARFNTDTFVYDLIYNPSQTHLLIQARAMGLRTANGLSLLLHQGALAFTLWTNRSAPLEIMRAALMA